MTEIDKYPISPVEASTIIRDEEFLYFVTGLILNARKSINLVQFIFDIRSQWDEDGIIRNLCNNLIRKQNAGVEVNVLLSEFNLIAAGEIDINNPAVNYLKLHGVNAATFKPNSGKTSLHSKFIVVDDQHAVVGSHNWNLGAMGRNQERSIYIKSQDFCASLNQSFNYYMKRVNA